MSRFVTRLLQGAGLTLALAAAVPAGAQTPMPSLVDPALSVRMVATGLAQPVHLAFLRANDMLVLEKGTGRVQRVTNGTLQGTALDLAVNSASERGLLSIALHPRFRRNGFVYLFWSESNSGSDSTALDAIDLMGNRVDRYIWDGSTLTWDRNLIRLRAFQADEGQPLRGNHNGGVIRFGPDGKLYIQIGDTGRRGQTQNLVDGPFGMGMPDDQFGGPEPDDAHLTGVILRLNDDGSAPPDNPFFEYGATLGAEVGANIQKIFAYGIRNGFGMAFDPLSGDLWEQENGDDSFSELNRVEPGMNSGWPQIMGPVERVAQFKEIETSQQFFGLQQIRWPPTNIADTPQQALSRLWVLPGSFYSGPEMAWKFEVAPGAIEFVRGRGLGMRYRNTLIMGGARPTLQGGHLFLFMLSRDRRTVRVSDPRLDDRVADNLAKFEITESESLLFGRNFGTVTDLKSGPDGNLYAVSIDHGNIYQISRVR
jgi:glucose/arabinose dehydrogenase